MLRKNMSFRDKIDKILETNSLNINSVNGLEKHVNASTGAIKKYYDKDEDPGQGTIKKIKNALAISDEDWNTGIFSKQKMAKSKSNSSLIPLYDAVAVGGNAMLADQAPVSEPAEYIDPGSWLRAATGSLRVYGNSMFPKYPAGSIIAFKESKSGVIIWGEDYVIELEDRRIVKRIDKSKIEGHIKAVSYNTNNEKYTYDPVDIPVQAVKRLYMVLGCVTLEASI
jgi:phage repressor protein C with HTH and peptisase S24 domain